MTEASSLARLERSGSARLQLLRVCLAPLFVVLCYHFDWTAWRSLTTSAFLAVSHWIGVPAVGVSSDSFLCDGAYYRMVISCTALDVFFGSVPLLWEGRKSVPGNILALSAWLICLSAVNLLRLELGFVVYFAGTPWWLAHEAMAGVFYFAVFLWIARQRGWGPTGNAPPAGLGPKSRPCLLRN